MPVCFVLKLVAGSKVVQMPAKLTFPEQAILRADSKVQCIMTSVPIAQLELYVAFFCWLLGSLSAGQTYSELEVCILMHGMHNLNQ